MHGLWIVFLFAVGACVGSFLNVVIWRLPRGQSIVFPSSHCPRCGKAIKWYDNIPILSWLLLRARCRFCGGRISPRYILIELLTAVLVSGLYVCYFVLGLRDGLEAGFAAHWPLYAAHAVLLCGLVAVSAVDIELFIVPLPVMWFCGGVGIVSAAFRPQPEQFLSPALPVIAAVCVAVVVGLVIAKLLERLGWIQESFLDAEDKPEPLPGQAPKDRPGNGVAITARHGVNPRVEILREVIFLAPAIVLGVAAYLLFAGVEAVRCFSSYLFSAGSGPLATWLGSGMGAVFGLLVGMALVWGVRIFGTLAFGKEAMGMGDVHMLAAIGAVAGWKVVPLTFFAASLLALLWVPYLALAKGKRELPYGPWLGAGALFVLVFYDSIVSLLSGLMSPSA